MWSNCPLSVTRHFSRAQKSLQIPKSIPAVPLQHARKTAIDLHLFIFYDIILQLTLPWMGCWAWEAPEVLYNLNYSTIILRILRTRRWTICFGALAELSEHNIRLKPTNTENPITIRGSMGFNLEVPKCQDSKWEEDPQDSHLYLLSIQWMLPIRSKSWLQLLLIPSNQVGFRLVRSASSVL